MNISLDHLYSHNLIPPKKFGFLPFCSTTDTLITACHHIQYLLDSSSSVCGVFLDIKKAFDSVSHTALLQKLYSINLPSNLCSWFHSYLSGQTQPVRVGNSISTPLPVLSGVPRDSILEPLLFTIFFNDNASLHSANSPSVGSKKRN